MRIKDGFIMREIDGVGIVIPVGNTNVSFNGICKLNKTCTDIWHGIENGLSVCEIANQLTDKYKIDSDNAKNDVEQAIDRLKNEGFIE